MIITNLLNNIVDNIVILKSWNTLYNMYYISNQTTFALFQEIVNLILKIALYYLLYYSWYQLLQLLNSIYHIM